MTQGEEPVGCKAETYFGTHCERWVSDSGNERCIFHSPNFETKKEFREKLGSYIGEVESKSEAYDFTGFVFYSEGRFKDKILSRRTFSEKAYFLNAHFPFAEDFWNSKFRQIVDFHWVEFQKEANFQLVEFGDKVNFAKSVFRDKVDFTGAHFMKDVDFSEAAFEGEAFFRIAEYGAKYFAGESCFRGLNLGKDSKVLFWRVSLDRASFIGTDLERIIFRDVIWHQRKSKNRILIALERFLTRIGIQIRGKCALWDEYRPLHEYEKERDYEKIAENYRQLVLNYERKRDYETAEDFHIGEMEMRRKKKGMGARTTTNRWLREQMNTYNLYRGLSNYGTSYWWGLGVLVLMLLVFSLGFFYNGFQPAETKTPLTTNFIDTPEINSVEYSLCPDSSHHGVPFREWVDDYGKAFVYSLSITTLQWARFYKPIDGWWSRVWFFFAIVVLPAQAALVLLAIRRRFKR